uniref:OSJNBa0036B21.9 protein n=1 Tax=Oryza sativa subsp. japonica TaxID=39947 RepID=Q7XV09_ORYSJ|nr:OSJNBa0036B21.9 [Oryza sativa Japonica Group]
MESMVAGDLVQAYVLKKACKEKMRAETNAGEAAAAAMTGKKTAVGGGSSEKKTAPEVSKGERRGFSGLMMMKKKVHPKCQVTIRASAREHDDCGRGVGQAAMSAKFDRYKCYTEL